MFIDSFSHVFYFIFCALSCNVPYAQNHDSLYNISMNIFTSHSLFPSVEEETETIYSFLNLIIIYCGKMNKTNNNVICI